MKLCKSYLWVALLALSLLSGCAAFRTGDLPEVQNWPPKSLGEKPSIAIVVTMRTTVDGKPVAPNPGFIRNCTEQILRAYRDSGLFSAVGRGRGQADLAAEVAIHERGEPNIILAAICGATFSIIPATAYTDFTIDTTFKDKKGDTLGTFRNTERVRVWMQLVFVVVAPFAWPPSVVMGAVYDINRVTILEANGKGIFQGGTKP